MITVDESINAPELAQSYQILRGAGSWQNGVWVSTPGTIEGFGVVTVASARDIEMVPEGDRVSGMMTFHSEEPIYGTNVNAQGNGASSDIIIWRGWQWRILAVGQFADYGYYRAVGSRLKAA